MKIIKTIAIMAFLAAVLWAGLIFAMSWYSANRSFDYLSEHRSVLENLGLGTYVNYCRYSDGSDFPVITNPALTCINDTWIDESEFDGVLANIEKVLIEDGWLKTYDFSYTFTKGDLEIHVQRYSSDDERVQGKRRAIVGLTHATKRDF